MLNILLSNTIFSRAKYLFSTVSSSYKILGVNKTASLPQIKKKYYQLAKLYHPDINKQQNAHQKFAQITKAYNMIIQKGSSYSQAQQQQQQQSTRKSSHNPFKHSSQKRTKAHFEQDWQQYSQFDPFFKTKLKFKKPRRGQDIYVNVSITLTQSFKGIKKLIQFTRKQPCPSCLAIQPQTCLACGGKGQIFHRKNKQKISCDNCSGYGYKLSCSNCNSTRYIHLDVEQQIYIEKNTHDKSILRVKNNGNRGYRHVNGDLYVTVNIEQSEKMKVDGNNIHMEMELEYITAVFGGKVQVETVQGKKVMDVPPGTQSGQELRIFNYGIKSPYSKQVGDHVIKFKIKVPKKLSTNQKKLMSELSLEEAAVQQII